MAVFLATSDEAIPIILSQPEKIKLLWPILLTKLFIAVFVGYLLDFVYQKDNQKTLAHMQAFVTGKDIESHNHQSVLEERACCGHFPSAHSQKFNPREIFLHPLIHTLKITAFVFLASLLLNVIFEKLQNNFFNTVFLGQNFWQPFWVALLGLIPNCAASVAVIELYLKEAISFGSVIAGLSAGSGLGLLVLFREEKKDFRKIVVLLFLFSVLPGLIIQFLSK